MSTLVSLGGREVPLESLYLSEEKTRLFLISESALDALELKDGSWVPYKGSMGTLMTANSVSMRDLSSLGFIPSDVK